MPEEAPPEPLGIDSLPTPPIPAELADPSTSQEDDYVKRLAEMTPAKRNIHLYERQIAALSADKTIMLEEKRQLTAERRVLTKYSHDVAAHYGYLAQAHHDLKSTLGFGALLLAAGGALISVAGALSESFWKVPAFWIGLTSFAWGFVKSIFSYFHTKPLVEINPAELKLPRVDVD